MIIRIFEITDCNNVIELWRRTPEIGFFCNEDEPEVISKHLNRNPCTSFVIEHDKRIIGSIMSGHDGWLGFIHHTCVDNDFRHKGLGKRLVETALKALKNEGINLVSLVVYKDNDSGNDFWEHIGFVGRPDLIYRNIQLSI